MYRSLPPHVKQHQTWTCWAAAMQSWLAVTPFRKRASQDELIEEYATWPNGGLDPVAPGGRNFSTLADDFSVQFAVMAGSRLTLEFIESKLKIGHVLLVFNLSPGVAHTNVVYGIGTPTGNEKLLSVMDPDVFGKESLDPLTGLYRNRPLSYYSERAAVIVGWPG